ncbi:hypothetical protein B0H13DRAFT_2129228 [Mycena leptocephala]|nr:hypothetical protein B0H13DRAFT_2129228 [Mycena leptocephala]
MALTSHSLKSRLDLGSTNAFLRRVLSLHLRRWQHSHSPKGQTPMPSSSGFNFSYQYTVASTACLVFVLILVLKIRALLLQSLDSLPVIDEALDDPGTRPKISDALLDDSAQGDSPLWHDIMVRNLRSASHYHNHAGRIKQPISLQPLYCCPRDPSIDMNAPTSAPTPALYAVGFLVAMPEPPLYPPLVSSSPDPSRSLNDNDHRSWSEPVKTRLYDNCA